MDLDFEDVLSIASQNPGLGSVQKRYSLQTGPSKKDPKVKGVNSAAVQAFLKKQKLESKKQDLQRKKEKDVLLAKRVEMKTDRKARSMASRTKDNFHGYNGIPVVEEPKKRRSKAEMGVDPKTATPSQDEDDYYENNYEYDPSDSDPEPDRLSQRPGKASAKPTKKPGGGGPPKAAPPPPMNFEQLLKLAEKKQFEPVELAKPAKKSEERLRTADEIRELEMERRVKQQDKGSKDQWTSSSSKRSSSSKDVRNTAKPNKSSSERPIPASGPGKNPKPLAAESERRDQRASKPSHGDWERDRNRDKVRDRDREKDRDRERPKSAVSSSSHSSALSSKASSQVSAKQSVSRPSSGHRPQATSDLNPRKGNASLPPGKPGSSGTRQPSASLGAGQRPQQGSSASGKGRPGQGSSARDGPAGGGPPRPAKGEPTSHRGSSATVKQGSNNGQVAQPGGRPGNNGQLPRPGGSSVVKQGNNGQMKSTTGGPSRPGGPPQTRPGGPPQARPGGPSQARPGGSLQARPGGSSQAKPGGSSQVRPGGPPQGRPGGGGGATQSGGGPNRPGSGGLGSGRPTSSMGSGPGRPQCTMVVETISSKNFGGPRSGLPPRPGMGSRPGMQHQPGIKPSGTMLPPITSSYKRKYEDDDDDEYDSEMDDFIEDEGDEQSEISKHIKAIFGYDRTKYKEESDYALKFMESSWKDQQKEEARSLRLGIKEDEEEARLEEEEMKRKAQMNAKRKKIR